jgi:mono/diheme cytochrome c family protein
MADVQLIGLFDSAEKAAEAVSRLRALSIADDHLTVMSAIPYRPALLGRPHVRSKLPLFALLGGLAGAGLAGLVTVGIFAIYPLRQGGQPLIPIPPSLIVLFELVMLGMMVATFLAMLALNRFPAIDEQPYDPRITEGNLGIALQVPENLLDGALQAMQAAGAIDVTQDKVIQKPVSHKTAAFWGTLGGVATVALIVVGLFVYDVIRIPFPTNMLEQDVTGYEQGPRLAAPAGAVPIQGPELIAGAPASQPVATNPESLQRGKVLYGLICQMCHGANADGKGQLSGFFTPKPADLNGEKAQKMTDNDLFVVITQGKGVMPAQNESLSAADRWNVINYLRALKK